MKKKYVRFDSVGGASGDMLLSALAGLGADIEAIEKTISSFFPEELHFHVGAVADAGLNGMRVEVHGRQEHDDREWPDAHGHEHGHGHEHEQGHAHGHGGHAPLHDGHAHGAHAHRGLKEIVALLEHSPLCEGTRRLALGVFRELAVAEAKIHGKTPDTVHFHEVGAWDSVADIVGVCLALEQLGVCGVACGPLPAGVGTISCAHGEMPNPAPATQELLSGMLVTQTDEPFELVTPTGAALLRVLTRTLEKVPAEVCLVRCAFGFGKRKLRGRPNVLRATLMETAAGWEDGKVLLLESNLDDCNPEWLGALTAELLEMGALDVWYTPVVMKKGRPGTVLSVLARESEASDYRDKIFRATTTFGIRWHAVERETLERSHVEVSTPYGTVPVKVGVLRGERVTAAPEHGVCAALARTAGVMPRQVHEAAQQAFFISAAGNGCRSV
ncbi:MAG: nickel pincer cofactor biosynthesis protein LarC [Kiritimatiellae bacterium]|nr:nickel pincer cofactor biosynthesis protein LarC [Kiritimatiellia bacterium]